MNYFIAASGTGIGKTLVTTALVHQFKTRALKPVISGFNPEDKDSDSALILQASGLAFTSKNIEAISPWRYSAPLAPSMAAAREGKTISLEALIAFCRNAASSPTTNNHQPSTFLVEGVGGLMVPLNERYTTLDWMTALNWPVIMVGGTYLGAISHTLSALEVLKHAPLPVKALVISESEDSSVSLDDTVAELKKHMPMHIPVVKIPRLTKKPLWEHAPRLDIDL